MDAEFWVAIAFVVFVGVLYRFGAFGTLIGGLDKLSDAIRKELEEAKALREEAQRVFLEYKTKFSAAEHEADAIIARAKAEAARYTAEVEADFDSFMARRRAMAEKRIANAEANGIVFLDEIDKICARENRGGADVSREGVQRDLLPLIEGTTVSTKHGAVKTDHILFIASGAFHVSKPSDLLPELQGRLPIRVELQPLNEDDFRRILTETEACLVKQYVALMETEGVDLVIAPSAVDAIARVAVQVNSSVENIGARRLQTVMERVLDEVSFTAPDRGGERIEIDDAFVEKNVGDLARNADLSRFIL